MNGRRVVPQPCHSFALHSPLCPLLAVARLTTANPPPYIHIVIYSFHFELLRRLSICDSSGCPREAVSLFRFAVSLSPFFRPFLPSVALGILVHILLLPQQQDPSVFHSKRPASAIQRTSTANVTTLPWPTTAHMFRCNSSSSNLTASSNGHPCGL